MRSRDDEKIGIEHARRKRDVDIDFVAIDGGDEPARSLHACSAEGRRIGGIAADRSEASSGSAFERLRVDVDDNEVEALVGESASDLAADPAKPAKNVVFRHFGNPSTHSPLDHDAPQPPFQRVAE